MGTRSRTVVPRPSLPVAVPVVQVTVPPTAPSRSAMFCRPWPPDADAAEAADPADAADPGSDRPGPSSATSRTTAEVSVSTESRTVAVASGACLATFCSASRTQKYSAASTSGPGRPTSAASTDTGTVLRWAAAFNASGSPACRSSGG